MDKVYLGSSPFGQGVYARDKIQAGEIILAFSGPIITYEEACAKGERQSVPLQTGIDQYMDLEDPGASLNHSCNPNAGVLGLELIALRSIKKDSEVRFDYSTMMHESYWTMDCRCESEHCRGVVEDFMKLPKDLQMGYISRCVVQPFILTAIARLDPIKNTDGKVASTKSES
ncbi:MAG: SET domain-containing protein [Candidatus Nanoarchaeia archaeon]